MGDTLNMSVSQIFQQNGRKFAFVSFTDGRRMAEGTIPDCKIISNKGFTEEEALQLEEYMGMELMRLKNMAASVRVMDAFLGKEKRGL